MYFYFFLCCPHTINIGYFDGLNVKDGRVVSLPATNVTTIPRTGKQCDKKNICKMIFYFLGLLLTGKLHCIQEDNYNNTAHYIIYLQDKKLSVLMFHGTFHTPLFSTIASDTIASHPTQYKPSLN